MTTAEPAQQDKLKTLIEKFKSAMLVTHCENELRSRPMQIAGVEAGCRVWFFTMHESGKVHELETDPRVNLTFQQDREIYVSLTGHASLSRDRAKIDELWREPFRVWFPDGKDDPNLAMILIEPQEGEYWDQHGASKIKYMFQAAKAYAAGTQPKIEEGEQHAKVLL